jgi:hypothetical protein
MFTLLTTPTSTLSFYSLQEDEGAKPKNLQQNDALSSFSDDFLFALTLILSFLTLSSS